MLLLSHLHRADVHIWSASLVQPDLQLRSFYDTLSPDELERAGRFHFQRDRQSFVAARGILREILAAYLGVESGSVAVTYGRHGKPALAERHAKSDVCFNLSHSADVVAVALARGRTVGVDIERVKPFAEVADVPPSIFSDRELAEFRTLTPLQQQSSFFEAWTRKEAFVKATGLGFSTSVKEVEVTCGPSLPVRLVSLHGDSDSAAHWTLRDVPLATGFKAAVATPGPVRHVVVGGWSER